MIKVIFLRTHTNKITAVIPDYGVSGLLIIIWKKIFLAGNLFRFFHAPGLNGMKNERKKRRVGGKKISYIENTRVKRCGKERFFKTISDGVLLYTPKWFLLLCASLFFYASVELPRRNERIYSFYQWKTPTRKTFTWAHRVKIFKKKKDSIIQHTAERWRVKRVHIVTSGNHHQQTKKRRSCISRLAHSPQLFIEFCSELF